MARTPKSLKTLHEAVRHVDVVLTSMGGPSADELREAARKLDDASRNVVMALYRLAGNTKAPLAPSGD